MDIHGVVVRDMEQKGLAHFLQGLDEKSRAILWHLWWRRHAEISELRNLFDASDDYEVLYRLREVINEKSQEFWGKPIVSFEQSKIDPLTGEKILFSWWYMDEEDVLVSGVESALVDVFNEKDNVIIIAQLPTSVNLTAPDIQFKNGILRVKFKKTNFEQNNRKVA
jgi:HSP20 family molecular chaperone IbpA